jgi:hypothetical protein
MLLISHRGNIDGKNINLENSPKYISNALEKGFDVEIDLWVNNKKLYLGHDIPQYPISEEWIEEKQSRLWLHCKNIECMEFFLDNKNSYNYFWHEEDTMTLTSKGFIWAYPGKQPIKNSIAVLPEMYKDNISHCLGICSDYLHNYLN